MNISLLLDVLRPHGPITARQTPRDACAGCQCLSHMMFRTLTHLHKILPYYTVSLTTRAQFCTIISPSYYVNNSSVSLWKPVQYRAQTATYYSGTRSVTICLFPSQPGPNFEPSLGLFTVPGVAMFVCNFLCRKGGK